MKMRHHVWPTHEGMAKKPVYLQWLGCAQSVFLEQDWLGMCPCVCTSVRERTWWKGGLGSGQRTAVTPGAAVGNEPIDHPG